MGMADADKRINLAAPLRSARRHGGAGAEATATGLPACKADDATSEHAGHASAVPFRWERRPGHPKSVRTRRPPTPPPSPPVTTADDPSRVTRAPTPTAVAVAVASERARDEDALSRDDDDVSVIVNCSANGLSDAASAGAASRPCARRGSVMMDRFLAAAHAVAAGSPQNAFRKAGSARPAVALSARTAGGDDTRLPPHRRAPLQHIAAYHLQPLRPGGKNDDDDANSDAHSTAGFAAKRCGLLPTRCVKTALLLSRGVRRGAGRPFRQSNGGGGQREKNPLVPRSRTGQQQHAGDDHSMQSWEEVHIKSLLRSGPAGGLMGTAVASELDRTVRELYKHRGGQAVRPKASHLGLLLVLDRSNEAVGHGCSPARKLSRTGDAALLLKATSRSSPNADAGGGGYGFPLLLEDKAAVAGREMALSPQPLLQLPLPKSPTESWLSRALPSVSMRPPSTSFLGLHVQAKKNSPLPWCSIDSSRDVDHDRQRRIRVHDLQK